MTEPVFQLNGRPVPLAGSDPAESLLRWLKRQRLGGTKEGCADGDCGACTVAFLERAGHGARGSYRAVNSCLVPMGQMPGREVLTVEALAGVDTLHPVQAAMVDSAGSQCGYCTPGFVMSLFAGYYDGELGDATIEGNLCRCTGYVPIRAAARALEGAPHAGDRFADALAAAPPAHPSATLGNFHNPDTLDEALALKAREPEAAWLAGATDLGVELSHARTPARSYIALDRIAALRTIDLSADALQLGAGVTLSTIERELAGVFPSLDGMVRWFAARQVRNRATLGGNLGTASPIGDLLPVLLALDAQVHCRSMRGARTLPIETYFTGYRRTARADDEMVLGVTIPRRPGTIDASYKVAKRQSDDISIVAAAFALARDADGRVTHVRLAYGGVAAVPLRAQRTEAWLLGRTLDATTVDEARAMLAAEFEPLSDHRAGAGYRRALAGNLLAKFVAEQAS